MHNELRDFARFSCIKMPMDWIVVEQEEGHVHGFWQIYHPPDTTEVEIGIGHQGTPIDATTSGIFRSMLAEDKGTIFDVDRVVGNDEELATAVSEALGNAGQNQLTMAGSEFEIFYLERLETSKFAGETALHFSGFYRDKKGRPRNYLESYNYDGNPNQELCRVYQLYLRAPVAQLFAEFRPTFEQVLRSAELQRD